MAIYPFTKMQGAGNDYIYINCFEQQVANPASLAVKISDRHFGVGGDGLVLILPSAVADVRMRMFNADGTEAEMCGNATRCVGKYAYDHGIARKDTIRLETAAGIKIIRLIFEGGKVWGASVDMGEPGLPELSAGAPAAVDSHPRRPITVNEKVYEFTPVSMGNPHAVVFEEDVASLDLPAVGPAFENHPFFPSRTNTEFVEILSPASIRMRVWERGSGETLACGTGACAAVVACAQNGRTGREVDVEVAGGKLRVEWDAASGHVFLSGPAVTVFTGEYPDND